MMLRATHVAPRSSRLQPFASSSGSACLAPPPCSSSSLPGCSGTSRRPSARLDCQTPPPGGNTASRQPGIAPRGKSLVAFASQMAQQASPSEPAGAGAALICTSVTAPTVPAFIEEIREAVAAGVDVVELRLDFLKDFDVERDLELLMAACPIPYIVTYRPKWEGGNYVGPEPERLAALKYAALRGAPYVDVEYKAAATFFAGGGEVPVATKVILSSHDFQKTADKATLQALARAMYDAGADIVKIATFANDVGDAAAVLSLLDRPVAPTIALAMGERGVITRLLATKYGGYLTFAALSAERASAPGQPTVAQLKGLFNFCNQKPRSKLFGIIGNPVSQSKSPLIHNTAFQHIGFDGVYVPLLVDDLDRFLRAFAGHDFEGFSVTIPHKEAALKAAKDVDPVAKQIGAVNTLIKQPGGSYKGYNTDWLAAISAIERAVAARSGGGAASTSADASSSSSSSSSPLAGKTVVVIGAGGAAKALAYGAASRGATVIIANRSLERAEQLAGSILPAGSATAVSWDTLQSGSVRGDVLANSTSVGMAPNADESPVPAAVVANFGVVFDAVYNPLWTQLLVDAQAAGCSVVDGLEMFVGQAVEQFRLFTGTAQPPVQLMDSVVRNAMAAAAAGSSSTAVAKK